MPSSDDEPNDNELIDDGLGNNRRYKEKQKKDLRLNYESDSSDEEQDLVEASKKEEADEDDDMFASDDEPTEKVKPDRNKVQLLDMDEFEKEEGIIKSQAQVAQPSSSEDDEDDGDDSDTNKYYIQAEQLDNLEIKAKKEPKLEAFSLRDDLEEGDFDVGGNFIRRKQEATLDDEGWLDDVKKSDIKKAKLAQSKREAKMKNTGSSKTSSTTGELLYQLIHILDPSETPLEALARFAPKKRMKKGSGKAIEGKKEPEDDSQRKSQVLAITELCDALINAKYISETYDLSREELMRKYTVETGNDYKTLAEGSQGTKRKLEDTQDDDDVYYGEKIWEFRWIDEPKDVNGPYSAYEMNHWKDSYFNGNVEVRKVGELEFANVASVEFEI